MILVLMGSVGGTNGRMRPVSFICRTHMHADAVLPFVFYGQLGIVCVVRMARGAISSITCHPARRTGPRGGTSLHGTLAILIVLALGPVLGTQVPVHVHWAKPFLKVSLSVWRSFAHIHSTRETSSHISACPIFWLFARTWVRSQGQSRLRIRHHLEANLFCRRTAARFTPVRLLHVLDLTRAGCS